MVAPVVTLDGLYVKIAWTPPTANNDPITSYQVLIEDATNTYIEDTAVCDGADATNFANLFCRVPMTKLWTTPFSLPQGRTITAKVAAINGRGSSAISVANTVGVDVETVPHQMSAPTQDPSTSHSAVAISWSAVSAPQNGDSAILSYIVYWDAGAGTGSFTELVGETSQSTATTYTITTGIVTGTSYQFKIKAVNKWGTGEFSATVLSVLAASVPG